MPSNWNNMVLMEEGTATGNGREAPADHLVVFRNDGDEVDLSSAKGATVLVHSGEPLNESIAAYGPFMMTPMMR
ncbi:MAG: hypothetical protein IPI81_01620 [Flavobacteriales bacterium]|nr:hypothetical protein [Flavobacteriales bacterium]